MIIEGRNAIWESLNSDRMFRKLFVQDGINKDEKVRKILSKAKNKRIQIKYVPRKFLESITVTGSHQGIIAKVAERLVLNFGDFLDTEKEPFLIYIREAQHQHNLGAIARSAECAGAHGIVVPPQTKMLAEGIRASTGAVEHIHVFTESLFQAIKMAKERGLKIIGIEVAGEKNYFEEDLTGPALFIIGGEDKPLSMEILKKCDIIVRIPLLGKVNSLNMSVASSIVMFDRVRQELQKSN